MQLQAHTLYHVYNRGNNRQRIFFTAANYLFFLKKLREQVHPLCPIVGYCLMPNHFHLLLYPGETAVADFPVRAGVPRSRLAAAFATLLSSYAQGINKQERRTGVLFEGRTQAKALSTERYAHWCLHYLHQNPVRAGLVPTLAEWPYASYPDYAGLRQGTLCDLALGRELLDLPADAALFRHESAQQLDPDRMRPALHGAPARPGGFSPPGR